MGKRIFKSEATLIKETGEIMSHTDFSVTRIPQEPPYIKIYIDEISRFFDLGLVPQNLLIELAIRSGYTGELALGPRTKARIAEAIKTTIPTLDNAISKLIKSGLIKRIGRGEFMLDPNLFSKGHWKDIMQKRATYKEIKDGITITFKVNYSEKGERKLVGKIERGVLDESL